MKKYFKLNGGKNNKNEWIEGLYDNNHVTENNMVVAEELPNKALCFMLFDSYNNFYSVLRRTKHNERNFYELNCKEHKWNKMVFDLDGDLNVDMTKLRNQLVDAILNVSNRYNLNIQLEDIMLFESNGDDKQSEHLIIDRHLFFKTFHNYRLLFCNLCKSMIDVDLRKYVDDRIYNNNRAFRMAYCTKKGKNRFKTFKPIWEYNGKKIQYKFDYDIFNELLNNKEIITDDLLIDEYNREVFFRSLITTTSHNYHKHTSIFHDIKNNSGKKNFEENISVDFDENEVFDYFLQCFPEYTNKFTYSKTEKSFIHLTNKRGYNCKICNRPHDHQHPYLFVLGEEQKVYFNCRQNNNNENLYVGIMYPERKLINTQNTDNDEKIDERIVDNERYEQEFDKIINNNYQKEIDESGIERYTFKQRFFLPRRDKKGNILHGDIDLFKLFNNFQQYTTILLEGTMGTGKTAFIIKLLEILIDELKKILSATYRKKLAQYQYGVFKDNIVTRLYDEHAKIMDEEYEEQSMDIVQLESILKHIKSYDGFLFDEVTSGIKQMESSTHGINLVGNRKSLMFHIKNTKFVILADATVDERAIELMNQRPGRKLILTNNFKLGDDPKNKMKCYSIQDKWINRKNGKPIKSTAENQGVDLIFKYLEKNKKISITNTSKEGCLNLFETLKRKFPNKKGICYTSDNGDINELRNVDGSWINFDYIIYNTSIGAGVSFNPLYKNGNPKPHFDAKFLFHSRGCELEMGDLLQMLERVRYTKEQKLYYVIPDGINDIFGRHTIFLNLIKKRELEKEMYRDELEKTIYDFHRIHDAEIVKDINSNRTLLRLDPEFIWTKLAFLHIQKVNISVCYSRMLFEHLLRKQNHEIYEYESNITEDDNEIVKEDKKISKKFKEEVKKQAFDRNQGKKLADIKPDDDPIDKKAITQMCNFSVFTKDGLPPSTKHCMLLEKRANRIKVYNYLKERNYLIVHQLIEDGRNNRKKPLFITFNVIQKLIKFFDLPNTYTQKDYNMTRSEFHENYVDKLDELWDDLLMADLVSGKKEAVLNDPKLFLTCLRSIMTKWTGGSFKINRSDRDHKKIGDDPIIYYEPNKELMELYDILKHNGTNKMIELKQEMKKILDSK